jgi:hypothetical protein
MMPSKWKSRRFAPSDGSYAIHVDLQKVMQTVRWNS